MNSGDIIILAAIAAALFLAVRSIIRQRKNGCCHGCSGNCADCRKSR